ncbi:antibiotic biosynthesis monooxygenase [Phenylobacterium sp.]|uniref:antibiotic biosynthesis monooxygenase family protein n=1 Tax=Phenylobacterium sp. TaxID=1871053 RepID=UPI0035B4BAD9
MSQVRSVIRFQVKPGREADFEAAFAETGMLSRPRQIQGFLGAELVKDLAGDGEYLVIGLWSDAEAYRSWQAVSAAGAPREAMGRLLDALVDPRPGRLYGRVAQG